MLELKFTLDEMEQLIEQGDAEYMNPDKVIITVYNNLYRKDGELYYNVEQRLKNSEKIERRQSI